VAHHHNPGFLALVDEARTRVRTMSIEEYQRRMKDGEPFVLVDVREDNEWNRSRLPGAIHLSRGVIEREIENHFDPDTPLLLYCGGGYRSVLVCDSLQKMGYRNVVSLDEGWRGWKGRGLPLESGDHHRPR
jgi:rhodanese-related sulfurtransferase